MSLGSIFKNIGNIFKTSEELEAEKRRQKRSLERGIEKSIDALNDGQRQAAREQEKFYQQGKQKLSVGRDAEARQFFQFSRMQARNAENYTRQKLMWSNALTQIKVAANMQTAAACFKDLAVQCGLNPDVFENGLESMEDVESTIGEMNKAMAKKWEKDSLKAGEAADDAGDATIDEMMERARGEVAAETGAAVSGTSSPTPGPSAV
jgi:hypothetical protein